MSVGGESLNRRSALIDRCRLLISVGRFDDAAVVVGSLLEDDPDDFYGHLFAGHCSIAVGRVREATQSWERATAVQPASAEAAVLGVRCAWDSGAEDLWLRVERLSKLEPTGLTTFYLKAISAARTGRDLLALETVEQLKSFEPSGKLHIRAAAEVDLMLSKRANRRPTIAEAAANELLAQDPLDRTAHDLRIRASGARIDRVVGARRSAATVLNYLNEASAAGHVPATGQIRALTRTALGSMSPVFSLALLAFVGLAAIDSRAVSAGTAAALVVTLWMVGFLVVARRSVAVANRLPAASRRRLVDPFVHRLRMGAITLAGVGAVSLLILQPFSEERGKELKFGFTPAKTVQQISYDELQIPTHPPLPVPRTPPVPVATFRPIVSFPPLADRNPLDPELPSTLPPRTAPVLTRPPTLPTLSIPRTPTVPIRVPSFSTVTVPASFDLDVIRSRMLFLSAVAAFSVVAASAMAVLSLSLARR